ncbi:MAG TPA: PssE/Cps14G family polysaccharide biosynthesis glycosyltransferase [Anaerohalosphaeraceae bacterium]|nr:PssE/Cps14G family polysaccharide biosynthesis glycosyltransferase [Anaerohalosphaeraceae bacterium]
MIFLTIGTLDPFDRLVRMVDELAGAGSMPAEVLAQIGISTYQPKHIRWVSVLEKNEFDRIFDESEFVISHAGMGSILTAVSRRKPMIVVPRLKQYGEHVNDHQLDTARRFEEMGVVLTANTSSELKEKVRSIASFRPRWPESTRTNLVSRIRCYLETIQKEKEGSL